MKYFLSFILYFCLINSVLLVHAQNNNNNIANNGGAYGGRYISYTSPAALSEEASFAKSYAVALHSWSYIGLYIGLAILGAILTWIYWMVGMAENLSAKQIVTIVTSTILSFVLLLLLVAVFSGWAVGAATP